MLQKMNQLLGKYLPLLTPASVGVGILLADYLHHLAFLVPWFFAVMTFSGSLKSSFKSLQDTITHPVSMLIALVVLHVITPLWAYGVGLVTFGNDHDMIIGLLLSVVIPTGVSSVIWVSMLKGNVALTLSTILIDTVLSPLIVPYSLKLFLGASVHFSMAGIIQGLFTMVVLPSILGMALNQYTSPSFTNNLSSKLEPFSKLGIVAIVSINASVVAPYFKEVNLELVSIAATVFFIALSGYFFAWMIGKLLKREPNEIIALVFTGGMRNISAGAVIAVGYFAPRVALPVVVGMLFQQLLASFYSTLLKRTYFKKNSELDLELQAKEKAI
ncbi:bile acid:sodium symporter family protein [Risungbinella massiliensis]|uniref:bile acid:sodium symporter family protein n=1 Tax=Risungbinella massiliensis TaxID=1329796 RepID=UPI0005CC301F|nr:bile acid:sodium symporter family protein [Risungbinella massiliensis]